MKKMLEIKSRLAKLLRNWAQRLDPECFSQPPINIVINNLQRLDVKVDSAYDLIPHSIVHETLFKELQNAILSVGGIKFRRELAPFGVRYSATMYVMSCLKEVDPDEVLQ